MCDFSSHIVQWQLTGIDCSTASQASGYQ